MKQFDLNHQYNLFLERMNLKEENMHPDQKTQLKQTFFGCAGQMMILLRDEVSLLPEDDGVKTLQSMLDQVGDYFLQFKGQAN